MLGAVFISVETVLQWAMIELDHWRGGLDYELECNNCYI